jgi:YesN/AraC family two-component response regulator
MNDEDILQVIKYVESNYAAASLKDAAARFGYNPDYLSRLIKSKLGISFGEMKHNVCLAQAKALLVCTDLSISEIAQQVGFSNMSFFYSLFNKYFQTTPAEFRKSK